MGAGSVQCSPCGKQVTRPSFLSFIFEAPYAPEPIAIGRLGKILLLLGALQYGNQQFLLIDTDCAAAIFSVFMGFTVGMRDAR